jgi:hypothetical protein
MMSAMRLLVWRLMAKGLVPARWIEPDLPPPHARAARRGRLKLEIVSHCWNYSHLLVYQLSSLVRHPPRDCEVTMTVLYASVDAETTDVLEYFASIEVENVTWNWLELPPEQLFRRGIGRNLTALASTADWVWFTDCDVLFEADCLDTLASALQGRQDALVFPLEEHCTPILEEDAPLLEATRGAPAVVGIGDMALQVRPRVHATGPLQIVHGDVCRAVGYCRNIPIYQMPSPVWTKAHEDGAFRWLVRSKGVGVQVPGVVRIRHLSKGRYTGSEFNTRLRTSIRTSQMRLREPEALKALESRDKRS